MKLDNLSAIVTGGASGLGFATVQALLARGVKVTVFDLDTEAGRAAVAATGANFAAVDVTDEAQVQAGLAIAGECRILVNCAGIAPGARVVGRKGVHSLDLFDKVIRINLIGTFNVLRLFAEQLAALPDIDGERGVIINTASVAAFEGQAGQAAYAASKAGIAGMTICLARDLASLQIRVMTIAPGTFLTPMLMGMGPEVHEKLAAEIPHPHRLGNPDEYATLAVQIVENPYLNGETIRLDGALRMGK